MWAPRSTEEVFTVKVGNLIALDYTARLRGKRPWLAEKRELACRQAAWLLRPVYSLLPSGFNAWADDLSRRMAPKGHAMAAGLRKCQESPDRCLSFCVWRG